MSVYLSYLVNGFSLPQVLKKEVVKVLEELLLEYQFEDGEVGIIIADDSYLEELNRAYRQKDGPTDVLSFSYLENEPLEKNSSAREIAIGDIFISLDRAREQAAENRHSLNQELLLLIIHGLLHLAGFDHNSQEDSKKMKINEQNLFKKFRYLLNGGEADV